MMGTPSIPDPKAPPRRLVKSAKAERDRRKACHGNWYPCEVAHPNKKA